MTGATSVPTQRPGVADVPPQVRDELERGVRSAANLTEVLTINFAELLRNAVPHLRTQANTIDATAGITRRMTHVGQLLLAHGDAGTLDELATHTSDTVRGWAAYLIAAQPSTSLASRLSAVRPLADDPHFAVREWAWLALRPHVAAELNQAITLLTPWTQDPSQNLRRFSTEITRPRGVWSRHIPQLTTQPELGRPLLDPLQSDPDTYVQDSVSNWINDAAKSDPAWARNTCTRWLNGTPSPDAATRRICRRALRSLPREHTA